MVESSFTWIILLKIQYLILNFTGHKKPLHYTTCKMMQVFDYPLCKSFLEKELVL